MVRVIILGSILGVALTGGALPAKASNQCWDNQAEYCNSGHQKDVSQVVSNYGEWQVEQLIDGSYDAEHNDDNYDIWLSFSDANTINIKLWVKTNTPSVIILSGDTRYHLTDLNQDDTGAFFDGDVTGAEARTTMEQLTKEKPSFILIDGKPAQSLPMEGFKNAMNEIYQHRGKGDSPADHESVATTPGAGAPANASANAETDMTCAAWNAAPKELGASQGQLDRLATVLHLIGDDKTISEIGEAEPAKGLAYARGYVMDITAACAKHVTWNMQDVAQAIWTHAPGQDW